MGPEPLAVCILAMLRENALVDHGDLGLAGRDLHDERRQAGTRIPGQAGIAGVADNGKQCLEAIQNSCPATRTRARPPRP
jgi:hypothetical protein